MTTPDPTTPTDAAPAPALTDAVPAAREPAADAADAATPTDSVPGDAQPVDAVPAGPASAGPASADAAVEPVVREDAVPADAVPTARTSAADPAPSGDAAPSDAQPEDSVPAAPASADAASRVDAAEEAGSEGPVDQVPSVPAPRGAEEDPRLLLARAEGAAEAEGAQVVADSPVAPAAQSPAPDAPAPAAQPPAAAPVAVSPPPVPPVPMPPVPQPPAGFGAPLPPAPQPPQPSAGFGAPAPHPYGAQPYPYPGAGQAQAQAPWVVPPVYEPKARKARPWLRTVARWTSAVAVMAVVGGVTTAVVTRPARTDVPGLATPSDGRWSFPPLTLPTLPPGNGPESADAQHVHRVDLRQLLLPAPDGATPVPSLPGAHGWLSTASLLALFANQDPVKKVLQDSGLRHTAATGWTMPDGTRTEIYLQQFRSRSTANDVDMVESVNGYLVAAPLAGTAPGIDLTGLSQAITHAMPADGGHAAVTYTYLQVGDTEALMVMSNPKSVPAVDFEQVVELQNRLLTA